MIRFAAIIGVLRGVVEGLRAQFFDDRLKGLGQIGDDLVRFTMSKKRSSEECSCRSEVASTGNEHVDDMAVLVDGLVDVPPFPGDFDVGLVDEPSSTDAVSARAGCVNE